MRNGYWLTVLAVAAFSTVGCEETNYQDYSKAPLSEGHDHGHDHGEVGKHGGHVLELDDTHAYHGELAFDAATRDITLYFYGAEIGKAKSATAVALELHDGDTHKELASKPMPLDGETDETASRWVVSGADLPADIKSEEQLDGHLEVTMDGKAFSYSLEPHSHDHDDHDDHAHGDGDHAEGHAEHTDGDHDHDHKKTEPKAN